MNVTLSIPDDLLREARHLAVDQGLSLSRFVARSLERQVDSVRHYRKASERQHALLEAGLDLGTHGRIERSRDELHER